MPIDTRFDDIDEDQWQLFAESWLAELGNGGAGSTEVSIKVTYMKFMARPEHLWHFIQLTTRRAENDYQLGHIAAGLVEQLLGKNGVAYFDRISEEALADSKFVRMMTGVRRHTIPEEIWQQVQELQSLSNASIDTDDQHEQVIEFEVRHREMLKEALRRRGGTA